MGFGITAGPGRVGVLLGGAERALEKSSRVFCAKAVPFGVVPCGCEAVRARGGDTACLAEVASWGDGAEVVAPCATFVSRDTNEANKGTYA
jgi:hypothetical protein